MAWCLFVCPLSMRLQCGDILELTPLKTWYPVQQSVVQRFVNHPNIKFYFDTPVKPDDAHDALRICRLHT